MESSGDMQLGSIASRIASERGMYAALAVVGIAVGAMLMKGGDSTCTRGIGALLLAVGFLVLVGNLLSLRATDIPGNLGVFVNTRSFMGLLPILSVLLVVGAASYMMLQYGGDAMSALAHPIATVALVLGLAGIVLIAYRRSRSTLSKVSVGLGAVLVAVGLYMVYQARKTGKSDMTGQVLSLVGVGAVALSAAL
jgi:hypothetical protein